MKTNGIAWWTRMTAAATLAVALFTSSSYVSFAQVPFTGELLVSGPGVAVNGELAANGRTIVVPSNIVTGPGSYATLNFTNVARIQVSPGSTFTVDGSGTSVRGSLSAGSVTIVSAANPVVITLLCGKSVMARSGEVVSFDAVCGAGTSPSQTSTARSAKHSSSLLYLLLAGAAVGVVAGVAGGGGGNRGSTSPTT